MHLGGLKIDLTLHDDKLPKTYYPAKYGWIIDRDEERIRRPKDGLINRAGTYGPETISAEVYRMLTVLTPGGFLGRAFRIYGEGDALLFSGRIITTDKAIGGYRDLDPLERFGVKHGGTEIRYWSDEQFGWVRI